VNGEEVLFRLDKDESYNGAGLLLQNLVNFFTLDIPPFSAESYGQTPAKMKSLTSGSQSSSRRRRMNRFIVQLSPKPRFRRVSEETLFSSPSFLHGIPGCTMDTLERDFNLLNSDQKNAVLKVVSAEDFALIQGLPGTGKTATIAFLTRLLVALGKRVLLTSYTHSAVDNLIIKLIESKVVSSGTSPIPILRIGRESSCHPRVHPILAQNIATSQEKLSSRSTVTAENPSVDYLHKVVSDAKIVGVSALSAPKSPLLAGQHFDYVIVDEAGQISQPAVLGAIMAADSFVLVGDHMQLPPLVCSEVAEEAGYGVSMLMRLAEGFPDAVAKLTIQYRMHGDICRLSNTIAYQGLLKCGNKKVQHGKLQLTNYPPDSTLLNLFDQKWIKRAINPDEPVVFLDTDGKSSERHGPKLSNFVGLESDGPTNEFEISIVRNIIQALTLSGLDASSIGIITPFRSQLRLLNEDLYIKQCKNDGLELSTIDRFQGRDKPAILFSLVRSNNEGKSGKILQDFRRLNVAFSRAKHKFVMIGSFSTLKKGNDVIRPILKLVREEGWIETVGSFKA